MVSRRYIYIHIFLVIEFYWVMSQPGAQDWFWCLQRCCRNLAELHPVSSSFVSSEGPPSGLRHQRSTAEGFMRWHQPQIHWAPYTRLRGATARGKMTYIGKATKSYNNNYYYKKRIQLHNILVVIPKVSKKTLFTVRSTLWTFFQHFFFGRFRLTTFELTNVKKNTDLHPIPETLQFGTGFDCESNKPWRHFVP